MILTRGLRGTLAEDSQRMVATVRNACGTGTRAVIHYGSRVHGAGTQSSSEYDFIIVVDDYAPTMQSLVASGGQRFGTVSAAQLSRCLPPSMVAIRDGEGGSARAKCAIYSAEHFTRACSASAPDHFLRGRLLQCVRLAYARDEACWREAAGGVVACREATFAWVHPLLADRFTTAGYCHRLLQVSYGAEFRPESRTRVEEVLYAQRAELLPMYEAFLSRLVTQGHLRRVGQAFALVAPATADARRRTRRYLTLSKARATVRWAKSAWLYRGWVAHLRQKMSRRVSPWSMRKAP